MFRLLPREEQFFDLFERQARNIVESASQLRDMIFDFSDAAARAAAIKELEHAGDVTTHELIRKINTTFVTPFDREDVYALASRLDDVLDLVEAASDRLVLYRIKGPTSGARALGEVIVKAAAGGLPGFPNYRFGLADERITAVRKTLEDLTDTDAQGRSEVAVRLPQIPRTARPLEADVLLRLREAGGRTIERKITLPVMTPETRVGIKPLHYTERDGKLAFASELKALLALPWVPRDLDLTSLNEYLTYEHIPTPRTIFQNIRKLPPGHLLTYDRNGLKVRPYELGFTLREALGLPTRSAPAPVPVSVPAPVGS